MGEAQNYISEVQGFCHSYPINWVPANLFDLPSRFDSGCAVNAAPWAGTIG